MYSSSLDNNPTAEEGRADGWIVQLRIVSSSIIVRIVTLANASKRDLESKKVESPIRHKNKIILPGAVIVTIIIRVSD